MEFNKDNNSNMDKLKKGLYSRTIRSVGGARRHHLSADSYDQENDWSHEGEDEVEKKPIFLKEKRGMSFAFKILIVSIVFFLFSAGVAFYRLYWGTNTISANNIEILVTGPVSVAGGEKLSLDVRIDNKNKTDLKTVNLRVEYTEGARSADDIKSELKRTVEVVGDILSGESATKRIGAVLFGEENSRKEIKIILEYRLPGSSAIFYKEKIYEIVISSSPVNVAVSGLKEVNANQTIDFTVVITSNSPSPINNLLLKAEYPFGFTFKDSSVNPSANNNIWNLGGLSSGQKKNIKISGKLEGQDGEDRIFRFTVGTPDDKDEQVVAIPFVTSAATVSIKKPFIGIQLTLDGSSANDFVSEGSKIIRADVLWKNNLPTAVKDVEIQIKLKGEALNKTSVSVERGFYRSVDNTIIFSKEKNPELASIGPGESGNLSFSLGSLSTYAGSGEPLKEATMALDIVASGKRLEGGNVPQDVLYSSSKIIKIATNLKLVSRALHWSGAFQNNGPMPPKAEQETTYTVVWTITNTSNKVGNAKVSATLPIYVKWLSQISPETEKVSFNANDSEIVWDVGDIEAGTGISESPKEVSFQISMIPSVSQIGSSPVILNEAVLSGRDYFTSTVVGETRLPLTTDLKTDPNFNQDQNKVVQ